MSEPLRIAEATDEGRRVLSLDGELDLATAPQLEERLSTDENTVLDLAGLSFIDSAGIHLLVSTAQRAQECGWEFEIRNAQPAVSRVMKLVGIDRLLGLSDRVGAPLHDASADSPEHLSQAELAVEGDRT